MGPSRSQLSPLDSQFCRRPIWPVRGQQPNGKTYHINDCKRATLYIVTVNATTTLTWSMTESCLHHTVGGDVGYVGRSAVPPPSLYIGEAMQTKITYLYSDTFNFGTINMAIRQCGTVVRAKYLPACDVRCAVFIVVLHLLQDIGDVGQSKIHLKLPVMPRFFAVCAKRECMGTVQISDVAA